MIIGCILRGKASVTPPKQVFSRSRLNSTPYFRSVSSFRFLVVLGLCCGFALSCASSSHLAEKDELSESVEDELPPDALIYGFVGIRHMGNLIENVIPGQFNNKQTKAFLKKTELAVFGLYRTVQDGENPAGQSVYLIFKGNYPVSTYNFGFAMSPKWKSAKIDGKKWWRQGTIALSIEKTRAYIRLGGIPASPSSSPAAADREFGVLFANARRSFNAEAGIPPVIFAAFISSSETSGFIRRLGIPLGIALTSITLAITAEEASYRSTLRINTKSPSEAKALSAILSLARAIGKRADAGADDAFITELIFANPPVTDGNTMAVTGMFSAETLISSFEHFNFFPHSPEE